MKRMIRSHGRKTECQMTGAGERRGSAVGAPICGSGTRRGSGANERRDSDVGPIAHSSGTRRGSANETSACTRTDHQKADIGLWFMFLVFGLCSWLAMRYRAQ
ncbi:protein UL15A [Human betaherpesvirus 5]|uniref:UL15A n=1 Tax=Human cytomegalovirus TaxID=10359 RepID=A8T773_HCMV|nr:UL15A [Human betaherpesvirus 5]ATP76480.1 protein UL15A [synthetic human betaherpesvirus 5]ACS92117.1 protein UL15A [Human betaherpesvirus 5]ACS93360.1 protein UL15A [Human betaherpesvirus 5]AFR55511.1 protein UL15A [Human betaherpesvirus 5]